METTQIKDEDFEQINQLYDECLNYLQKVNEKPKKNLFYIEDQDNISNDDQDDTDYEIEKENFQENGVVILKPSEDDLKLNNTKNCTETKIYKNNLHLVKIEIEGTKDSFDKQLSTRNEAIDTGSFKQNNEVDYAEIKEEFQRTPTLLYKIENESKLNESSSSLPTEPKSERLRRLSQQLPKIIITQSNSSLNVKKENEVLNLKKFGVGDSRTPKPVKHVSRTFLRRHKGYGSDYPKRLVSKNGLENVALISNVPFEKIRLLNDTFHTLINLRWRWIIIGTVVVHFTIWLVFAVFWYIAALAHYDFEPNPPNRTCVTGGKDFVTIFLASVEAQTTIGFGDRAIDEECPESIFLFIMQLILGTGLSGVLTCVVYAKLTRPEKLSKDGVGFSKKAVISMRDGNLCLMMRAWDLNYDHIISSEFNAHFVNTHRTKEGEVIRYYAKSLPLQQRQFLLWPVTLVHVIDEDSPLYHFSPQKLANHTYEITLSLKGASASMGTFTQSQTSYVPKEILWGHRFPSVVKYDSRKRKYVIEDKKLDLTEPVDTPYCSAKELNSSIQDLKECPATPSSFSDQISGFTLNRVSSFR